VCAKCWPLQRVETDELGRALVFGTMVDEKDLARLGFLASKKCLLEVPHAAAAGTHLPWLTLPCAPGAPARATRPGLVPHSLADAASCLVDGAQQRFGARAGGPVLNRPLTNLCFSSTPFSPSHSSSNLSKYLSPPPLPFLLLHPQPVIPSPAPSLPTVPWAPFSLPEKVREGGDLDSGPPRQDHPAI